MDITGSFLCTIVDFLLRFFETLKPFFCSFCCISLFRLALHRSTHVSSCGWETWPLVGNDSSVAPLNVSPRCQLRCMEPRGRTMEGTETTEMRSNLTTPHIYPTNPKPGFPGYYTLIPLVLLTLIGCVVAVVRYVLHG